MSLIQINAGRDVPKDVHVVIEIPMRSEPVKYEVDKESGALFVDRFLITSMYYPCNYGYIPQTLSEDGDPVDVLVISPLPLLSASVVRARPVGMLEMEDEAGIDAKLIAVPHAKLCPMYQHIQGPEDVDEFLLKSIAHFFEHYKDLEPEKWVKVKGWLGAKEAFAEIEASVARYKEHEKTAVTG